MMRRAVILGPTGSGKTTFGRKLAQIRGCAATDLDDLHWLPGWKQRATEDFQRLAAEAAAGEDWVIMGNYSKVRNAVWPRADAFIWLDYPFPRVLWRLLRRCVARAADKNPICNGNVESWRQLFSKNSLVLWLFQSYWRRGREYAAIFDAGGHQKEIAYIRLRSPKEAEVFLERMKGQP